jgi:hypothetical protein
VNFSAQIFNHLLKISFFVCLVRKLYILRTGDLCQIGKWQVYTSQSAVFVFIFLKASPEEQKFSVVMSSKLFILLQLLYLKVKGKKYLSTQNSHLKYPTCSLERFCFYMSFL